MLPRRPWGASAGRRKARAAQEAGSRRWRAGLKPACRGLAGLYQRATATAKRTQNSAALLGARRVSERKRRMSPLEGAAGTRPAGARRVTMDRAAGHQSAGRRTGAPPGCMAGHSVPALEDPGVDRRTYQGICLRWLRAPGCGSSPTMRRGTRVLLVLLRSRSLRPRAATAGRRPVRGNRLQHHVQDPRRLPHGRTTSRTSPSRRRHAAADRAAIGIDQDNP